ncbi:hypothetical protein BJ138DRAFT_1160991 [Hygrophoropsis aurantiaca]|uniref:Uncharacterized protein n=1 Tax=Hygrophoropsis aurantiaca TaxID=72124 RepID=A0ACB8A160_9AGAM|nr:hypothetical protein BJ138DRAFT_1160991 [Hygrophoropsis aurantiaca]
MSKHLLFLPTICCRAAVHYCQIKSIVPSMSHVLAWSQGCLERLHLWVLLGTSESDGLTLALPGWVSTDTGIAVTALWSIIFSRPPAGDNVRMN